VTVLPAGAMAPAAGLVPMTWPFGTDGEPWLRKCGCRRSAMISCPACCVVRPRTSGTAYLLPLPVASTIWAAAMTAASTRTADSIHGTARRRRWPGGGVPVP